MTPENSFVKNDGYTRCRTCHNTRKKTGRPAGRTPGNATNQKVDMSWFNWNELLAVDVEDRTWYQKAACRDLGPDMFYTTRGGNIAQREAVEKCEQCPVRINCLVSALHNADRHGVWGGLSERARRPLRHRWADTHRTMVGVRHGTRHNYDRGCRCEECHDAKLRYSREYNRRRSA